MGKFSQVSRLPEFDNDLKKLGKRFRTIEEDLGIFVENELFLYHKLGKDTKGVFQISGLSVRRGIKIYKARKFACRSLKGKGVQSGIRVIYTYFEDTDTVELIEIYYKGDKENEDGQRISRHYSK
jgi:mRNA-degrading endonuclease RelE of RelBE toxin-antitoxin system